ncbi:MAG: hypothetical protein K2Y51_09275 [Gammaproteobacteria bacterium]|nr:hypothetical protein [Gammaproteobacteria bacterium]
MPGVDVGPFRMLTSVGWPSAPVGPALAFVGSFTTLGGVAFDNVAIYDTTAGVYLPNATYGRDPFGPNFAVNSAAVYQGDLYLGATNGDVYKRTGPQTYTQIYNAAAGPCVELVVWQNKLVIATREEYPVIWDGVTATPVDWSVDVGSTFELLVCALGVVTVASVERLCVLFETSSSAPINLWCATSDDGVAWTFTPVTPAAGGNYLGYTFAGGYGAWPAGRRRWVEDGSGRFYVYRNFDPDGNGAGNNSQGQVQRFDPATNTLAAWNAPNPPFITNQYPRFDYNGATNFQQASAAEVGGRLLVVGGQKRFSGDGVTFANCDRSVELLGTYGTGNAIGQVGGFLANEQAEIFQAHTGRIFVGFRDATQTGQVTQLGGGLVSGGAALRLATFDGSTWAAWPEQPNGSVRGVFELPALPT